MERFVFIAAVTFAVIFGLGAVLGGGEWNVGHGEFNIEFDDDHGDISAVMDTSPGRMEAQAFQGEQIRIVHGAARVSIASEDRQDFLVEIDNPGRTPMPLVRAEGGRVIIDGQMRGRVDNCLSGGAVDLKGYGDIAAADLPHISIRAPRSLVFAMADGGVAVIGPTHGLRIDLSGCSDAAVADVAGVLDIDLSGSGAVRAGAAQSLNVDLSGSGEVAVAAVASGADLESSGSGDVAIASLAGPLSAELSGSGGVAIQAGDVSIAKIDLSGSGGADIGAGIQRLEVSISGSGDVDLAGAVGDIEAEIDGSGGVHARAVSGRVTKDVSGSGDVHISGGAGPQNAP